MKKIIKKQELKISVSNQDEVTGTKFTILTETAKQTKKWNIVFLRYCRLGSEGQWSLRNGKMNPTISSAYFLDRVSRP